MLRAHRRGYHALAADWLAEVTERHGRVEEYAAVIAEHTDLAGDPAAARWYLRAGARAARVYASEEALRLLGRGLRGRARRTTRCCGSTCSASASRWPTAWPSATGSARTST